MSHNANNIFKKSQRNKDWKRDGKKYLQQPINAETWGQSRNDSERTMLQVLVEHHKNLHLAATSARGILVRTRNRTPLSVRFWKCKHCSVIQSKHSKALRWVTSRLARAGNCFGSLENKTRENIEEFHIKTWICGQHEHVRRAQRLLLLCITGWHRRCLWEAHAAILFLQISHTMWMPPGVLPFLEPQNFVFQELHTQQGSQGNARTARVKNDARHWHQERSVLHKPWLIPVKNHT